MEQQDFQHIALSIRPKLLELCRKFFKTQELAYNEEDAVQETFLRLWQMRHKLDEYKSPEALAIFIAKNICIDILRHDENKHEPLDETINIHARTTTDQQVMTNDINERIRKAIQLLPNTQRRMIQMRSDGMSMAEIAATCGTTQNSTKTMICTARKKLMELLKVWRIEK